MLSKVLSLAVVAPFYNEQSGVREFYEALRSVLETLDVEYQMIFVDDGSADGTLAALNRLADEDRRVTVLSLTRNFGHQIALTAGLDHADADAVVTMDSDLQHPPAAIRDLLREFETGVDIVYAIRRNEDNRSLMKRITARVFYRLLTRLTNVDLVSGAMDFRIMSRRAVEAFRQMPETHRYLRGMVAWMGFPYKTVLYDENPRFADQSKYTLKKMLRLARHGFFSFSTASLEIITFVGFLMTAFAMAYLVFALLAWLFAGHVVPGWTSVIAVILIVSGVQLVSVGILAQYIGMIFEEVKRRPLYLLKQSRVPKRDKSVENAVETRPVR
jgi:dolichol-phosphate mannosyltransferase